VDANGVRTEVTLSQKEAAVVKKVPVRLKASEPVNVVFRRYDDKAVTLGINGEAQVTLTVADGEFEIRPGVAYLVKTDRETRIQADAEGRLVFSRLLNGPLEVAITATDK
jgi:hypothetical protein